ncbi:hypothetical protein CYLTODRAFT_421962 [Cylindrobasidium torrendii FP15055 ss-10]|uniref:Uncharacterized protein n=1 Tax=Cylindrobasidium torrendii FP15055 ss-10 TaxID=1314674 RepID=A0A0D7BCY2_9AGAR|nr:hypothetical protein CYLTODRAFT_421962 [Cylindrobasidium torrendii FP15055 ss-10]
MSAGLSVYALHSRTVFNPMHSIPDDILGLIFEAATCDSVQLITNQVPWTLTQVCRRWRAQASRICTLWNRIFLDMSTVYKIDSGTLTMLLCLLLERSREADLTITWDNMTDQDAMYSRLLTELLQPHTRRMVGLSVRGDTIEHVITGFLHCSFPRLRSLNIDLGDDLESFPSEVPETHSLITIFQDCQHLRDVALFSVPNNFIMVPWESLNTISIDGSGIWIIPKATSVTSLRVSTVWTLESDQEDTVPLTSLAHLQSLTLVEERLVRDRGLPAPLFLLSRIHAPSLTTLTIGLETMGAVVIPEFPPLPSTLVNLGVIGNMTFGPIDPETIPTIIRFLERVHVHVKTLYLEGYVVRVLASAWVNNPLLFPAVTNLRLRWARAFAEEGIRLRRAVMTREVLRESGERIVPLEEIRVYRGWSISQDTRIDFYNIREKEPEIWQTELPHLQINIQFMDFEDQHEF